MPNNAGIASLQPLDLRSKVLQKLHRIRMWWRSMRGIPAGSRAYASQLQEELSHYKDLMTDPHTMLEPAPEVWDELLDRADARIEERTGAGLIANVVNRLVDAPAPRLLSLGCGAAGIESIFARQVPAAAIHCVDLNSELLSRTEEQARIQGLRMFFKLADLNSQQLNLGVFDVVFCHASLHHFIALEHVIGEIERSLAPGGRLIVVDIITRNGYRMYPHTRRIARTLFDVLPPRYRLNQTAYAAPTVDSRLYDPPRTMTGVECHRSEDILPLLRRKFTEHAFVPYFCLCRRFFDPMYGPNYDLSRPLDRAIVDWIWELDCHYLDHGILLPESFFGIYGLRQNPPS